MVIAPLEVESTQRLARSAVNRPLVIKIVIGGGAAILFS